MDLNQFLSKSAATLLSPSKLACLQSKPVSDLEHPIIIPLGGGADMSAGTLGLVPVQVINPQLLLPLDAIQANKESALLFPAPKLTSSSTAALTYSASKPEESKEVTCVQDAEGRFGISVSMSLGPSDNGNLNCPLGLSAPLSLPHVKSLTSLTSLNQNLSVECANPLITSIKQEIVDTCEGPSANCNTILVPVLPKLPPSLCSEAIKNHFISHNSTSTLNNAVLMDKNYCEKDHVTAGVDTKPTVDSEGLSKIISSLPPGWKVVGLTNLLGADGAQATPVLESQDLLCGGGTKCNNSVLHLQSGHHQCHVPDVVSIDLNHPTTSSLPSGGLGDNFDNHTMDSILLPMNLSSLTSTSCQEKSSQSKSSVSQLFPARTPREFPLNIKQEPPEEMSPPRAEADSGQNEWRVVGLTSSPLFPPSSSGQQLPSIPLPVPVMVPSEGAVLQEDQPLTSRSPKATILNVPSPKLLQQSAKSSTQHKSTTPAEAKSSSEEMKWTIVGVTVGSAAGSASATSGQNTRDCSNGGVSNANPCVSKADCEVTNSSQRPVSSSVSKNAPLSLEASSKAIDSSFLNNQWKVVGVAQCSSSGSSQKSSPQILPLGYQLPVQLPQQLSPLLVTSIPSLPTTTTTTTTSIDTATTGPKSQLGSAVFSSPSPDSHLQNSLMTKVSNPDRFPTPPLLPLPASLEQLSAEQQLHLCQMLHTQLQQQQELQHEQQLTMNPFSLHNQLPFLNSLNKWNVVGLLSDALPSSGGASNGRNGGGSGNFPGSNSREKIPRGFRKIEKKNAADRSESLISTCNKAASDYDGFNTEYKKSRPNRSRDATPKFTKKNTVSHLLKLKRMKMKGEECSALPKDPEGRDSDASLGQSKEQIAVASRAERDMRSRPLHSYAGNRKLFTKSLSSSRIGGHHQQISLRSGAQLSVASLPAEEEQNGREVKQEPWCQMEESQEVCQVSCPPVIGNRSAARKRKLKIPRKMVADLDYQPFDSSSDSN